MRRVSLTNNSNNVTHRRRKQTLAAFNWLDMTATLENVNYENQRFCAVPDYVGAASICKWGNAHITWCWGRGTYRAGLPEEQIHEAFERGVASWCKPRSGLTAEYTQNYKTANVLISFSNKSPLGSRLGVLAWCELPCNPNQRQVSMMIDDFENWTIAINPPRDMVDLERVFKHELGHGIGIAHIADGNLMAPTYSTQIPDLMKGDFEQVLARYPKPPGTPTPDTPPPTGEEWKEIAALGTRGTKLLLRAMGKELLLPMGIRADSIKQLIAETHGLPLELAQQAFEQAAKQNNAEVFGN